MHPNRSRRQKLEEKRLTALFARALRATVSLGAIGAAGCGGSTLTSPGSSGDAGVKHDGSAADTGAQDAGTRDAGFVDVVIPFGDASGCGDQGCACSGGCTAVPTCVNGQLSCSCDCPQPVDSGNPCAPTPTCGDQPIPLSCFDALPPNDGGALSYAQCTTLCPSGTYACSLGTPDAAPATELICQIGCAGGRAFAGMDRPSVAGDPSPVGRYLAEMAYLESAAVSAFRILQDELTAHGAPEDLVAAAGRAADDEVRHARVVGALARRHGAAPTAPRPKGAEVRPLVDLAVENAVEGCVRETYAALVARHQAAHAEDVGIRRAMTRIADDETRHAALGWAVAAWADARLSDEERARVREAREAAVRALQDGVHETLPTSLVGAAGLPGPAVAEQLVAFLGDELWA